MANEISIQAVLTQQRFSPVIQGAANKDINAAISKGAYNVQQLSASFAALNYGGLPNTNLHYLFLKNLDASIAMDVSVNDGTNEVTFAKLNAQEFCLVPVFPARTIKAKAASSPSKP